MKQWNELLREKASSVALKSKHVKTSFIIMLCAPIIVALDFFSDRTKGEPIWLGPAIGLFMMLAAGLWGFYCYKSAQYMITNGIHVVAAANYTARISGSVARLVLQYKYDGKELEKIINVHPTLAREIDSCGSCEILVDPRKPTRIMLIELL